MAWAAVAALLLAGLAPTPKPRRSTTRSRAPSTIMCQRPRSTGPLNRGPSYDLRRQRQPWIGGGHVRRRLDRLAGAGPAGADQRRIQLRLEEQRQASRDGGVPAASADPTFQLGKLGLFITGEGDWIKKDVTRFEPGFSSDAGA